MRSKILSKMRAPYAYKSIESWMAVVSMYPTSLAHAGSKAAFEIITHVTKITQPQNTVILAASNNANITSVAEYAAAMRKYMDVPKRTLLRERLPTAIKGDTWFKAAL